MYKLRQMMTARLRDERGFTLVELMMVMVIIGVLAGLGFTGFNALQNRSAKAQADVYWRDLNTAAAMYRLDKNKFPTDINELIGPDKYLDETVAPWNADSDSEFRYILNSQDEIVCVKVRDQAASQNPQSCPLPGDGTWVKVGVEENGGSGSEPPETP